MHLALLDTRFLPVEIHVYKFIKTCEYDISLFKFKRSSEVNNCCKVCMWVPLSWSSTLALEVFREYPQKFFKSILCSQV